MKMKKNNVAHDVTLFQMLILANGAYGTRQVKMCDVMGIPYHVESFPENVSVCADRVRHLVTEEKYSLVSLVHCETSSGVLNPIEEIGNVVKATQPGNVALRD